MKRIIYGVVALLSVAMLSSCCGCGGHVKSSKSGFPGQSAQWRLVEMNGQRIAAGMLPDRFMISFDGTNNTISGIGACNRFTGTYSSSGKHFISIHPGGMTRMACPDMALESEFMLVLSQTNGYRIDSNMLMLMSNGKVIATLAKE